MKKFALLILVVLAAICTACGPYGDYAGTYVTSDSSATYTVTLSASGKFRFERKFKAQDQYAPDKSSNVREGTYTVSDGKIVIKISYYDPALREQVTETAEGRLSGNKLIVTGSAEISGSYAKK